MHAISITFGCLFISFLWNIFFWDRTYGVAMPVFALLIASFILWFKWRDIRKAGSALIIHLLLVMYLSIGVGLYRNDLIFYATIPTIYLLLVTLPLFSHEGYS